MTTDTTSAEPEQTARNTSDSEERKAEMFAMKFAGKSLREIGEHFGITRQTVHEHLKRYVRDYAAGIRSSGSDEAVGQCLAEIDLIIADCLRQAGQAEAGSTMKYNFLDLAARRISDRINLLTTLGVVREDADGTAAIARETAKMTPAELRAKRDELIRKFIAEEKERAGRRVTAPDAPKQREGVLTVFEAHEKKASKPILAKSEDLPAPVTAPETSAPPSNIAPPLRRPNR